MSDRTRSTRYAAGGEPGHGPAQHGDRGGGGLIVVDLGVGDAGVVIDGGVHERSADLRAGCRRACRCAVAVALSAAEVTPAAAVGDVAELLHIDVQQCAGMIVFVAADRLTGRPVEVGEPIQAAADQHRVHRRGRHTQPGADLHRPEPFAPSQVHDRPHERLRGPAGDRCGREDRSAIPAGPTCRYRLAQRAAVGQDTSYRSAARATGQPSSTISRASLSRARGVSAALAWDTKTSWSSSGCLQQLHSTTGGEIRRSSTIQICTGAGLADRPGCPAS